MGSSDKAFKILTVAAIASVAAYLGYRAYKKRYPFEDYITKVAPSDSNSAEAEVHISGNKSCFAELSFILPYLIENCCLDSLQKSEEKTSDEVLLSLNVFL